MAIAAAKVSAGKDGVRSPVVARDPVADELHPAVARLRLLRDVGRQVGGLDLVGVVADVAAGAGEVAAAADQAGQVVAVLHPAGVGRRAAVAEEERTGVAVGDRLLLGRRVVDRAVGVEAEVAVGVDQPGHDPALGGRLGPGLLLEGDPAVDDVEVTRLAVRQHGAAEAQGGHGPDATGSDVVRRLAGRRAVESLRRQDRAAKVRHCEHDQHAEPESRTRRNALQFGRFALVGGSGVVVNLLALVVVKRLGPRPEVAIFALRPTEFHVRWYHLYSTIAFLVANLWNFQLNRTWTFRSSRH